MSENSIDRRTLVRLGATSLALFGLAVPSTATAQDAASPGGIAGGGSMQAGGGPAEFSAFAVTIATGANDQPVLLGALSYLDVAAKTRIESTSISALAPVEGRESTTWQLSGMATVDGAGAHPFNAVLTDGGPIGSGLDQFELVVGQDGATDASDPVYEVQSTVQAGNIQRISVPPSSTGAATPTPAG